MKNTLLDELIRNTLVAVVLLAVIAALPTRSAAEENGLEFGFQHRARFIDYENITDYSDANDDLNRFFRFRSRLWGRLIRDDLELKLTLANEFRHYLDPERDQSYDEIFVDECYLKLPSIAGSGWSIAAGRQNISKGDGMLIFDGSPLEGSRSIYFNALVISGRFDSTTLDVLGISNPARDRYLPRIGDKNVPLSEYDDSAAGLYVTHKTGANSIWEAVWMYQEQASPYDSDEPGFRPDRSMHVLGGRLTVPDGESRMYTCELAGEFGEEEPDRRISAWAGHLTAKQQFDALVHPVIKLSAAAFSGDDESTSKDEGWSPPFSRWPKWSDSYIYSLTKERGVAFWSNMWFVGIEVSLTPIKPVTVRCNYYKMMSIESPPSTGSIFGTGKNRGDLFEIKADFTLVEGLTGHVLYEHMLPGNFYADDAAGHYLQFELTWQFSRRMPL